MGRIQQAADKYGLTIAKEVDRASARRQAWDSRIAKKVLEHLRKEFEPSDHVQRRSVVVNWTHPPDSMFIVGFTERRVPLGMTLDDRIKDNLVSINGPVLHMGMVLGGYVAVIYTPAVFSAEDYHELPRDLVGMYPPEALESLHEVDELLVRFFERATKDHWTSMEAIRDRYHLEGRSPHALGFQTREAFGGSEEGPSG